MRPDNLVLGVTPAATLWFVIVIGLCFGGGEVEGRMKQERRGTLMVIAGQGGPGEPEIRAALVEEHYTLRSWPPETR